jgi:hypothetical protein
MIKQYFCLLALVILCILGGSSVVSASTYGSGNYGSGIYNGTGTLGVQTTDSPTLSTVDASQVQAVAPKAQSGVFSQTTAYGFGALALAGFGTFGYVVAKRQRATQ